MIYCGDCLEVMPTLEADSVDAVICDPPYGLTSGNSKGGFMGKEWDKGVPGVAYWKEALRVAKPGCHLLAFGGSRTFHRLAVAIEDAGWEIRDTLGWIYGQGFPKSLNLKDVMPGFGTALKPAYEPIILARKPIDGTVANNVLKWGCGGINVDGCRVGTERYILHGGGGGTGTGWGEKHPIDEPREGRFPANIIHDGSNEVMEIFPEKQARFFYCAKASKKDRDDGLEGLPLNLCGMMEDDNYPIKTGSGNLRETKRHNAHPTVKPTTLMRYLCRLITPPDGLILDPFMGSGSTGKAAILEGFRFIGIELEPEYVEIAKRRIDKATLPLAEVMNA